MARWIIAAVLFIAAPALVACGASPCDELADLTCKRAGEDSETCVKIRERAETANADQRRACELALGVVDDFSSPE